MGRNRIRGACVTDFSDLNVFQMFVANGERPGFWLRRTTSGNTCAQVTSVGPFNGPPPYYGNPLVSADIYDLLTGELKERGARIAVPGTLQDLAANRPPKLGGSVKRIRMPASERRQPLCVRQQDLDIARQLRLAPVGVSARIMGL